MASMDPMQMEVLRRLMASRRPARVFGGARGQSRGPVFGTSRETALTGGGYGGYQGQTGGTVGVPTYAPPKSSYGGYGGYQGQTGGGVPLPAPATPQTKTAPSTGSSYGDASGYGGYQGQTGAGVGLPRRVSSPWGTGKVPQY